MTEKNKGNGGLSRRNLLKHGAFQLLQATGVLIVARTVVGCGGSSSSGGGGAPANNPPQTQTVNLMAHLKSEYDITPKSDALGEMVLTVRSKTTGGVLADQDIMIFVIENGQRKPITSSATSVTVKVGDSIEIGQTVTSGQAVQDPLQDYIFVAGPFSTSAA